MPNKKMSSSFSSQPSPPEIEHLEQILRGYKLSPGKRFYEKLAGQAWLEPDLSLAASAKKENLPAKSNRLRFASIIAAVIVAVFMITPFRDAVAQIVSRFFKVSPSEQIVVTVSLTPYPTPDPEYSFNQEVNLTIPEAEYLAGFKVKAPSVLTDEWEFQGARYKEEEGKVTLFYYAENLDDYSLGYLFINQFQGDFKNNWGLCPNGVIEEVSVGGWPAEVAHGAVWTTYQQATPGAEREWQCEKDFGLAIYFLRWEEGEMKYEIKLSQGFRLAFDLPIFYDDLEIIDIEELIQIAESMQ